MHTGLSEISFESPGSRSGAALALFFFVLSMCWSSQLLADDVQLEVTDPYLELHTGPGIGFPIFHVVDRGERIVLRKRKTDWYYISTANGFEGWASRHSLESTLTSAGVRATFRDTLLDDYLNRHLEIGFAIGSLDLVDPMIGVRAGYRIRENLAVELGYAQAAGNFSSSTFTHLSLVSHPFPEWRLSPFFALGVGRYRNTPKQTLIGTQESEAWLGNVAAGVNWYVTGQFVLRAEYRRHAVYQDVSRINEFNEYSLGVSLFFF